jgi:hypothetical protein
MVYMHRTRIPVLLTMHNLCLLYVHADPSSDPSNSSAATSCYHVYAYAYAFLTCAGQ